MKLGMVGLPNVGKSTLFNAITQAKAEVANYPFCTIEPNVGIVNVPDERLNYLSNMYNSKKVVPAILEFVDIAGLIKGASTGEGLGNKFLSHIREVDAIVHVVRCFSDSNITHVSGSIDPVSDIETINYELILSDIESVEKKIAKIERLVKVGEKQYAFEFQLLEKILKTLHEGKPARAAKMTNEEKEHSKSFFLLSSKPMIYCANVSEEDAGNAEGGVPQKETGNNKKVKDYAKEEGSEVIVLSAKIENELAELDTETRAEFLKELGITGSGLDSVISCGYRTLSLISYLTAGEKETRAWTIENGTKAPQAAGKIHTDFEKGFIRAEVVAFDDLKALGSMSAAKEKGKLSLQGKEYIVKDGDVMHFRFNV
ncbi:MAG: redox-regulated ATPase YchF [Firmicutes bacterium]|nr:redox-regulated ATPase YchF [Bacillota bacterium]